jgi:hypothetical protein
MIFNDIFSNNIVFGAIEIEVIKLRSSLSNKSDPSDEGLLDFRRLFNAS